MRNLGECGEHIRFPDGGYLGYSLIASHCSAVGAEFERGSVRITLPWQEVLAWSGTEDVGIYATIEANGVALDVIVEKDYLIVNAGERLCTYPLVVSTRWVKPISS